MLLFDFLGIYTAAKVMLAGVNPYDLQVFSKAMIAAGYPNDWIMNPLLYPPLLLYLFAPLTVLPVAIAGLVWNSLMLFLTFFVLRELGRQKVLVYPEVPLRFLFLELAAFWPLLKHLYFGQTTLLALVGGGLALVLSQRKKNFIAGVALSLCIVKPHLLSPLWIGLGVLAFRRRQFLMLVGFSAGVSLHAGLTLLLYPLAWSNFVQALPGIVGHHLLPTPTIWNLLLKMLGWESPLTIQVLVWTAIGLFWVFRERGSVRSLVYEAVPLSLLTAPYLWSHDFVLLLPLYLWLGGVIYRQVGERAGVVTVLLQSLIAAMFLGLVVEYLTIVFPFLLLIGVVVFGKQYRGLVQ